MTHSERLSIEIGFTTRQVTDVVMFDTEILSVKLGRQVEHDQDEPMDEEMKGHHLLSIKMHGLPGLAMSTSVSNLS